MISIWSWLADAILVVLLTATLVMAVRLDRALRVVRRDRAVFEALINNLGSATNSVKLGIQALRNEADRAAEQIERRTEDADKLATDLSFLIDAADRAGARLEEGRLSLAAQKTAAEPETVKHAPPAEEAVAAPASPAPAVHVAASPVPTVPAAATPAPASPVAATPAAAPADANIPPSDAALRQLAGLGKRRRARVPAEAMA